ncbi:MAG: AMP-binding protein, partial [Fimbriimonadaceae bacterium]|nr:AMP-binding protein [Alphaproteobacteria bacterium]
MSLIGLLDEICARRPDAAALVDDGQEIGFDALRRRSNRVAAGLARRGIGRGDRVAIWLANRPDWLIWLAACARLGAIAVAVNTRFRSAEVGDILKRCAISALVYEPGFKEIDFAGILANIDPAIGAGLKLVVTLGDRSGGDRSVTAAQLEQPADRDIRDGGQDDGLVVFTTSGTTSQPKFVLHTQKSIVAHARNVAADFSYTAENTVLLQALPLCGTFGLAQLLAGLAGGCVSVLMPVFEAREAVRLIARYKVTTFNGPDGMFAQIVDVAG